MSHSARKGTEDTGPACCGAGTVHYETGEGERHQEYPVRN